MAAPPARRTFVAGEIETATYLNSLGAVVDFLLNPPRCNAYQTTSQSIPNAVATAVTFDAEIFDSDTMHDNVTNNSRVTATTSGMYDVNYGVTYSGNATGGRRLYLYKNGAGITGVGALSSLNGGAGTLVSLSNSQRLYLAAGDYLSVMAYQDSGAALTLAPSSWATFMSVKWVAAS